FRIGFFENDFTFTLATMSSATVAALIVSHQIFSQREASPAFKLRPFLGLRALLWLNWQQARGLIIVIGIAGPWIALFHFAAGLGIWVSCTMLLGIVCGIAVFAPEQGGGANRFLGDQRLPMA